MDLWKKRAIKTAVAVVSLIFVSSFVYHYVMIAFEGRSPSYFNSLRAVVETYTGTGYGADSPWDTPVANVLVTVMDLSTFLLVFIILPYVFQPVLSEVLSPDIPDSTEMTDHIVVCGYTERTRKLVEEFENRCIEYVVLVDDEEKTMDLMEEELSVVNGDPSSAESLRRANVDGARSVVVDTEDRESASVVLAVKEVGPDARVVVLVRDTDLERYLVYAGADAVLTPRHLLGKRIAERIEAEVRPRLTDSVDIGDDYGVVELSVMEESPVCGQTLGESGLLDSPDVTVSAVWKNGEFVPAPSPETRLGSHTSLLVTGQKESLGEMESVIYTGVEAEASVVVAGFGEVGSTVMENLRFSDTDCVVVDIEDMEGVSLVGDATEEEVLREAGVQDATAFVSTVQDDDVAILSVLVARELASDIDIIARVNHSENENKARRAGGDYVLSLPDISGRMLASEVLREEILSYDRQLKIVRVGGMNYAGETLRDTRLGEADMVVVAVRRDDEVITDLGGGFVFEEDDEILVAGTDEKVDRIVDVKATRRG
jgi:Trk K+ transport system NAD-binding subunit